MYFTLIWTFFYFFALFCCLLNSLPILMESKREVLLQPLYVAKCAFDRWLKMNQHCLSTRNSSGATINAVKEIDMELAFLLKKQSQMSKDDFKTLWKSSICQLRRLFKKYSQDVQRGEAWLTSRSHGNNLLSDCEEALLCGLLTGVHQKQVVLT